MSERNKIWGDIMKRGWNPRVAAFTQQYKTKVLDASLLRMPLTGFVTSRNPKWLSTLAAIDRELVSGSLAHRFKPSASPDGLHGQEGTFSLCPFCCVDALARFGRPEDAVLTRRCRPGAFRDALTQPGTWTAR